MNPSGIHTSIFFQLVFYIEKGIGLLDKSSIKEIEEFVSGQQHRSGAFVDRSGASDIYYSLFGYILAKALKLDRNLDALRNYISKQEIDNEQNLVNKLSLILLSDRLTGEKKKIRFYQIFKRRDQQSNIIYRIFLFALVFDARYGKNHIIYFLVRLFLRFWRQPESSPASILAALIIVRRMVGLKTDVQVKKLLSHLCENGSFKSFEHLHSGDMLSTGVSLFALKKVGFDLRKIAPVSLDFVQDNYDNGAFLSGDGDQIRDLEYTFYGLLALGCVTDN